MNDITAGVHDWVPSKPAAPCRSFRDMMRSFLERKQERDRRRGYNIDYKRVAIAYLAESIIVAASLWGAWLFANMYGHNDNLQIKMMMLAPIGYAVIEFCRVPLAISARAHASRLVRSVAIIGVLCASGVTVKSMSQLGEIMFRPRLFDVTHSKQLLQEAEAAQATVVTQIANADAEVASRRKALEASEQRVKDAGAQLSNLPKNNCMQISGTDKNGNPYRGQRCNADPRIAAMQENLKLAVAAHDDEVKRVQQAVDARGRLDRTEIDHKVAQAHTNYDEALLHSQLHSFAAMFYGAGLSEVTDAQVHRFLRIFVFFPAIFVAFASSFVAFTAVNKIPPELIPFAPEGPDYLLNSVYQAVLRDAVERVATKQQADAENLHKTEFEGATS